MIRIILMVSTMLSATSASGGSPDTGTRHFINSADHVRITGIDYVGDHGDQVIVTVVVDPEFHINANPASENYLIPTTLEITHETPLRVIYPRPLRFKPRFADRPIDVYQGEIQIIADLPASSGQPPRPFGTLIVQACTDTICLPPSSLPLPGRQ